MVFQIGCRRDLVEAARLISEGSLSPEDLVFNSRIVESIKIDSPKSYVCDTKRRYWNI